MKKTKLEIIRINEDVISTSLMVKGSYSGCIKLASYNPGEDKWGIDYALSASDPIDDDAGTVGTSVIQDRYRNAYGVNPSGLNQNDIFCVYYDGANYYYYKHDDLGSDHSHS